MIFALDFAVLVSAKEEKLNIASLSVIRNRWLRESLARKRCKHSLKMLTSGYCQCGNGVVRLAGAHALVPQFSLLMVAPRSPTLQYPHNLDHASMTVDGKPVSYWPATIGYVVPLTVVGHPVVAMPVVRMPAGVLVSVCMTAHSSATTRPRLLPPHHTPPSGHDASDGCRWRASASAIWCAGCGQAWR